MMRSVPERERESERLVEVGSDVTLKTPLFESVSASTRSSVSPVLLFVTRTTTVSIFVPFTLQSVSRMTGESDMPGSSEDGKVPLDVVSPQTTRMLPERDESVAV